MLSICLMAVSLVLPVEKDFSSSYAKHFMNSRHQERVLNCMLLAKIAQEQGQNAPLILAIASVESGFLSNQKSPVGALGLMGLMPSNIKDVPKDKRTKKVLVLRSMKILNNFKVYGKGDICKTLAMYNAGMKGSCKGKGGGYAKTVLDRWYKICFTWGREEECSDC